MTPFEQLAQVFSKFPGIGRRQAKRFAYFVVQSNPDFIFDLQENILETRKTVKLCSISFQYFTTNDPTITTSPIVRDETRDNSLLLIVEKDQDIEAFEKSQKDSEVQLAIDSAASKHFPMLEKRTSYLSMLANISTLLGLLGTISGLIVSFAGAAKADPNAKATLLAQGISEAMNCTAFGLLVAIPTLLFYAFIQGRTQKIIDDVNEVVLESMNFLVSHKEKLKQKA
jgi:biopolymer transport protein ExbB/TolQ